MNEIGSQEQRARDGNLGITDGPQADKRCERTRAAMDNSRLTLTNRPENLRLLLDFVHKWARDRSLPPARLDSLELAAGQIFRHLVEHAYQPGEPGSIAVELGGEGPQVAPDVRRRRQAA